MQLFIGGAHAGKRDLVAARFPDAAWYRVDTSGLEAWRTGLPKGQRPSASLVVTGWPEWLEHTLPVESDDDRLRARLVATLESLVAMERQAGIEAILILPEMGRGIVPMDPLDRRLRDLAGWLAQDAAARAEVVWYVRHGLARRL